MAVCRNAPSLRAAAGPDLAGGCRGNGLPPDRPPGSGYLAFAGSSTAWPERLVIAAFGIRGIGSFHYLAHALNHAGFEQAQVLWATAGFIVLASIVMHGIAGSPVMRYVDRNWRRMEH